MDGISGLKKKEDEILVNDVDNLYVHSMLTCEAKRLLELLQLSLPFL